MRVSVLLPERALLRTDADRVVAESLEGSFCLELRHIDIVAPLVPGILTLVRGDQEQFLATAEGVLVKLGQEVLISVRDAVTDAPLGRMRTAIEQRGRERRSREQAVRQAAERLETALVRRFAELREPTGGPR
jgi:F-type H+-transporting ATPase subunit epsilon